MIISPEIASLAEEVVAHLKSKGITISLAESCTGGLVCGLITAVAGSSVVLDRGFVVYSNQAKIDLLDVKKETLIQFGAVSLETAKEMAVGAFNHANVQASFSVTGIAGPGGGTTEKPVGTVCIGWKKEGFPAESKIYQFSGDRHEVRMKTVEAVLGMMKGNGSWLTEE